MDSNDRIVSHNKQNIKIGSKQISLEKIDNTDTCKTPYTKKCTTAQFASRYR